MPAGKHKLSVVAVDRATNEGPASSTYFYSDPDTPTVTFGSFSRNVGTTSDLLGRHLGRGGHPQVVYRLDGDLLGHRDRVALQHLAEPERLLGRQPHAHRHRVRHRTGAAVSVSTTIKLDKTPLYHHQLQPHAVDLLPDQATTATRTTRQLKFRLNKAASVTLDDQELEGHDDPHDQEELRRPARTR